jgi:hypothetical protein
MNIKLFETQDEAEEYAVEVLASQGLSSVMKPRRIVQRVELNKVHTPEWLANVAWIVIPMGPTSRAPFVEKVLANKDALEEEVISLTNKLDVVEVALNAIDRAVGEMDAPLPAVTPTDTITSHEETIVA